MLKYCLYFVKYALSNFYRIFFLSKPQDYNAMLFYFVVFNPYPHIRVIIEGYFHVSWGAPFQL